ncbi:MAG: CHAT domain-containing protein [Zoogloeaceae bacterium]|nr:CHAT domain-containing protein [Zoogloeaceae bacterium]
MLISSAQFPKTLDAVRSALEYAILTAVICLLCIAVANAQQIVWLDTKEDLDLDQRNLELFRQNRASEAAELIRERIRQAGRTVNRQNRLCNALRSGGEMGALAECVTTLRSMLVDGRIPARSEDYAGKSSARMETDSVYLNALSHYRVLGDFTNMIALGEAGRAQLKFTPWALSMQYLGEAHAKHGDRERATMVLQEIERWDPGSEAERAAYRTALAPPGMTDRSLQQAESSHIASNNKTRLTALSLLSFYLEDFEAALRYFDRRKALGADMIFSPALNDLIGASDAMRRAMLLVQLGRFDEARAEQDKAEKLQPGLTDDQSWDLQFCLGRIAEGKGNVTAALVFYRKAIAIIESRRSTLSGEAARIGFVTDKQQVYVRLIALLIKAGAATEAFEYAERGKSRALVDLLASRSDLGFRKDTAQTRGTEVERLIRELRAAEAGVAHVDKRNAEQHTRALDLIAHAAERLNRTAPEAASLITVRHIPARDFQVLLKPDEAILEYFGNEKALFAFIVTSRDVRSIELDATMLNRVTAFRKALQDPNNPMARNLARSFHASLIEPLGLPSGTKLFLVPHGALHYLPFAALDNGQSPLIERHLLRVLPSASVISLLAKRPSPANRNLLIFGNPDLRDAKYDLPGAQKEAEQIARLRSGAKILMREKASKESVNMQASQYAYLHFATHGTFDARSPRSSGLLLAVRPEAGNLQEGMLTVDDLYSLDLNAELVTMSACETALADVQSGDDLIGLTRGFLYAGAKNIVASLWQVDDAATEQLMVQFYKNMATSSKAEALRRAQLSIRVKYPHPFYWAAFQLNGLD